MLSRRELLATVAATLPAVAHARTGANAPVAPPVYPSGDDDFWRGIQREFTLDRTIINLNNGGCCPTPRVVHEAFVRYLDQSNLLPPYELWQLLEPNVEAVRRELAIEAGCDAEELAITRNASEALQIAQSGLSLSPGDEVVITDQDYPRMLDTWDQRARRAGVVIKRVSFPAPLLDPADFLSAIKAAFTPKTKVVHISQVTFLSGAAPPVKEACALAREAGILSIVDGAHAFAHVPTNLHDMGCDFYGTSLHKWLLAPVGTGFLYMRKEHIAGHWALQPTSPSKDGDIRKFEEIGTHPAANHNAIAEALAFHRSIGSERKLARLRWLRHRWTSALAGHPKIRFFTNLEAGGALCTFAITGLEPAAITTALWDKWRIFATPIVHPAITGVRITPNVYTMPEELDTFVAAVKSLAG
ncbi:isopenicillin-N epimerase [Deltaproteobacteria bacterium]|nr:isopenicillin-N epimerase [Deltaproteobacteria bacterium]